jgi:hypothetical protein
MKMNVKYVLGSIYEWLILSIVKKANTRVSQNIPKIYLKDIHINKARLITNREALLKLLPQNGVVAELAVDEGNFSQLILLHFNLLVQK